MSIKFKSENILDVVKQSREVLKAILQIEDPTAKMIYGATFMALLNSVQEITSYITHPDNDKETIKEAMVMLDQAIERLETDMDDMIMGTVGLSHNPNNKGNA